MRMFIEQGFKGLFYFLKDKSYRSFIYLLLRHGSAGRFLPRKIKVAGNTFYVPDVKSFIWQFYEIYYSRSYKFTAGNESPTIFDCGANVGTSCVYFKELYPQSVIHAYEPDPKIFDYLSRNLKANGISDVTLHNKAVWNKNETLTFNTEGADGGAIDTEETNGVKVQAIRLRDDLARQKTIDLLKIDIEGAEVQVIKDCDGALDNVQKIFIEYHSYNNQPQDLHMILDVVARSGFRYYIENESNRRTPFVDQTGKGPMDMQVNIFGYRP